MKRIIYSFLVVSLFFSIAGCDYVSDYYKAKKYKNKVFTVRTEIGNNKEIVIWKDAANLSYDKENYSYDFYVNGKLVTVDAGRTIIIIEEQ
jgi:hypothetical protein